MSSATLVRRGAAALSLALLASLVPTQAQAQELIHRFINPSFGGNPFYSDHLVTIANIHRPAQPEEPADPLPDEAETLVRQLQSSLNAQVQSQILDAIRNARPGQTGEFTLGTQRISFVRTQTETRVTFLNTETNESREIVVPVPRGATGFAASGASSLSPEQALGALGTGIAPVSGSNPSSLLGTPPL